MEKAADLEYSQTDPTQADQRRGDAKMGMNPMDTWCSVSKM